VAHDRRQPLGQLFEVTGSFRQHDRRTSLANCRRDVIDNQAISSVVGDQRLVKIMELDAQVGVPGARWVESRRTHPDVVGERSLCGLFACADSMADRSALHENDRVVPVLAGQCPSLRVTVADRPRTYLAFARRTSCSKLDAGR